VPFEDFPLLTEKTSFWDKDHAGFINGIHQAGIPSGAIFRAAVDIE
jgi:hypothetical protein